MVKTTKEARKPVYKYCVVPMCKNTIRSTPDKVFFPVPRVEKIRKQWCNIIRRDELSPTTCLHCCQDHFDIEQDTENYLQYNIMKQEGVKVTLRLKKGVLPHIFHCRKRNMPLPVKRMGAIKRQRLALVEEALSESAVKSKNSSETCEQAQTNNYQAGPSTSHIEVSDKEDKLQCDKAVQVNIKPKYRSKGVNVNFTTEKNNIVSSPCPLSSTNATTSPLKSTRTSDQKKKKESDNPVDGSTSQTPMLTPKYEISSYSSDQEDSENETHLQNFMHCGILTIEFTEC